MLPTRDQKSGKYRPACQEGLDPTPISVKVPFGMKEQIRELSGSDLSTWVREAIAEKLAREQDKVVA